MFTILKRQELISFFFLIPIIWTMSFLHIIPDGRSVASNLLVVFSLISVFIYKKEVLSYKNKPHNILILSGCMLVAILYKLTMHLYHGEQFSIIRTLSISLLYIYTFPYWIANKRNVISILTSSSIIIFISSIYFIYTAGWDRYFGYLNPNKTAVFCASLICLSFLIFNYIKDNKIKTLLLLSSLLPIPFLLLTGSRGALLSLLIAIPITILYSLNFNININIKKIIYTITITSIITIISFQTPIVKNRYQSTLNEIKLIYNGNLNTSIGLRFQMWESAFLSINENPILGNGHNIHSIFETQYNLGLISDSLFNFSPAHYHNQYLDILVRQGVIGFLIAMFCFYFPMIRLLFRSTDSIQKSAALGTIIVFSVSSLTEVPFNWAFMIYYFFIVNLLISSLTNNEKES